MGLKRSPSKGRLLVNADEYRYSEEDCDFNKKKEFTSLWPSFENNVRL